MPMVLSPEAPSRSDQVHSCKERSPVSTELTCFAGLITDFLLADLPIGIVLEKVSNLKQKVLKS